ncbi:MAG: hypothetical protein AB8F26_02730 [Phycisphaerales bacterium]
MGDRPAWKNEYTLLCERCGYVIEGLPTAGACPECSKPIQESLPERREGSQWQRDPRITRFHHAMCSTLRHPLQTLDEIRPFQKRDRRLSMLSMLAAGFLISLVWWSPWVFLFDNEITLNDRIIHFAIGCCFSLVSAIALACLMWILTRVETVGLGVIARTRKFRIPASYRRTITAHGCAGWVLGSLLFIASSGVANQTLGAFTPDVQTITFTNGQSIQAQPVAGAELPVWLRRVVWHSRWLGLLVGFMWFEIFAYLGVRRLKYVNTAKPNGEAESS